MTKTTSPDLEYIRRLYAPQDRLLDEIDEELAKQNMSIQIGAEEGKILQLLIKMNNVRNVVEIGTLAGYSAIWIARALPEGGKLYTINKDTLHINLARGFFEKFELDNIEMLEGNAHDILPQLSAQSPFDMVFIDADKISYNNYLDWAEVNVKKGGLIVADNTLLFGAATCEEPPADIAPTTWKNIRSFNERLADESRYCSIIIPTEQGLTVAIKMF